MRERISELSGRLEIPSDKRGTLIEATAPLPDSAKKSVVVSSRLSNTYSRREVGARSCYGIALKKQEVRPLMERFGATEKVPSIAKPLKEMVGTRRLELLTSTVS